MSITNLKAIKTNIVILYMTIAMNNNVILRFLYDSEHTIKKIKLLDWYKALQKVQLAMKRNKILKMKSNDFYN